MAFWHTSQERTERTLGRATIRLHAAQARLTQAELQKRAVTAHWGTQSAASIGQIVADARADVVAAVAVYQQALAVAQGYALPAQDDDGAVSIPPRWR